MNRILLLLGFVLFISHDIKAQFFDFDIPSPFISPRNVDNALITPPSYKGGESKMNDFLKEHFREIRSAGNVSGVIVVDCRINEKGKVYDCAVVRKLEPDLDKEAMRVVKKMKFIPAKQLDKKVKGRFTVQIPIRHGKVSFLTIKTIDV